MRLRCLHHIRHPVTRYIDARHLVHDFVDLRDDDAVLECGAFGDCRRVFRIRPGVQIAVGIRTLRRDQRDAWRQVHEIATIQFQIGMDRTDIDLARLDQARQAHALVTGVTEVQA
ncbi:hypothetical protein D3C81_1727250 [compost metagenome]